MFWLGVLFRDISSELLDWVKSLMRFMQEKNSSLAVRFDMNPPSIRKVEHMLGNGAGESCRVAFALLSLPLYMVGELSRLIEWV